MVVFSNAAGEKRDMYLKSENITVTLGSDINYLLKTILIIFLQNTRIMFLTRWKPAILLLIMLIAFFSCQKINLKRSESDKESPDWLKNKKAKTTYPQNNDEE